jgi:hydroxymethylglutaryl-CoA lyase
MMRTAEPIQIVECPRDAMQGWHSFIPTDKKIAYLNALLKVGFHTLDFGSFVSPKAIPQMRDTAELLPALDTATSATPLLAIIANTRGATEALAHEKVAYLGFPFSISETFQQRNTNSSIEESLHRVEEIQHLCVTHDKQLVIYLSMAFGNPYRDAWDLSILQHWADKIVERGIKTISLADTVGLAQPEQIHSALTTLSRAHSSIQFGVHLHSSLHNWEDKVAAAYDAGCRRYDSTINGTGGCPFAKDELVGNISTQLLLRFLDQRGEQLTINGDALDACIDMANEIFMH